MRKKNENPKRNLSGFLITLFYVPSAIGVLTILIVGTVMHLGPVLSAVLLGLSCFSIEVSRKRIVKKRTTVKILSPKYPCSIPCWANLSLKAIP